MNVLENIDKDTFLRKMTGTCRQGLLTNFHYTFLCDVIFVSESYRSKKNKHISPQKTMAVMSHLVPP